MLGQVTLVQAAGILLSIGLTIALGAIVTIGIPLAREWWQRRQDDQLSNDSRDAVSLEATAGMSTLRHATGEPPTDLRPILLLLLALHARKSREEDSGKERGQEIEREIRDITRENARAELSKRADTALIKYARTGKIDTDTDVYALLGVKTETGQRRLKAIREQLGTAVQMVNATPIEDAALVAEIARVKALPRDPDLERMIPLPV